MTLEIDWDQVREVCPEAVACFVRRRDVFGLELRGGARVSLKFHRRRSVEYLAALQEVQEHLWRHGYPCPRPLGVRGHATIEEWRDDGVHRDAHEPEIRRVLARELVRVTRLTRGVRPGVDLEPHLPRAGGPLWPPDDPDVHVEWIDEIARAARAQRDVESGDVVLAHHDWTAGHFRFQELRPSAVYDWDSLSVGYEPVFVGDAAAYFTYTEELEVDPWPSVDETFLFIDDYARARNGPFSKVEHATAAAAAVYARACAARRVLAGGGDATALDLPDYAAALLK